MKGRSCELCDEEASLYCPSDSAFLCWNCDSTVHKANFLVSRHVRRSVCLKCEGFDGVQFTGVGFLPLRSICGSCSQKFGYKNSDSSDSCSSSTCISCSEFVSDSPKKIDSDHHGPEKIASSSTVSNASGEEDSSFPGKISGGDSLNTKAQSRKNLDSKVEGILVNWCRKLGLKSSCSLPIASHALSVFRQKLTVLPYRISVASSLWFSLKLYGGRSASNCQNLKKMVEISGVPAKLILLAELKLSRALKNKQSDRNQEEEEEEQVIEEGWGENLLNS